MNEAIAIFIAGFWGVFLGMAALYFSIKIITLVAGTLGSKEGPK